MLLTNGDFDLHREHFFVPGLLAEFSAAEISALIAPRRHLSMVGLADPLTPVHGVASIDVAMIKTYAELGVANGWTQIRSPVGHVETAQIRELVLRELKCDLRGRIVCVKDASQDTFSDSTLR